jgi:Mg2+ and Co2+ transporter CorA
LRVIHVQNAKWATEFLLKKFNIKTSDSLVGTAFGVWAKYENPKSRGQGQNARPVPRGKTFRAQNDPWRGIARSGFGLDYLMHYPRRKVKETPSTRGMKMMELNHYDSLDNPSYGYDAYAQRLSVYVQLAGEKQRRAVGPEIRNPYLHPEFEEDDLGEEQYDTSKANGGRKKYVPKLDSLDNGSTIIIFEHSQSGSVYDTLIGARQQMEDRWRKLTFFMPREDTTTDEQLAVECMDFILRDIFKALALVWEKYINICETHVSILEDKIYENPADESRAPELWTNSSLWLKVERLMSIHMEVVKEMRSYLRDVAHENPSEDDPWLSGTTEELEKLEIQFRKGVVTPTASLSDLMYKSVGIRDARHSLQLGLSMWRLSWITFIFLPLTFVCGFFGMNVDTFEGNPSIKWWFITTVPLFVVVIAIWYGVKHTLASQRRSPLRRGVYENLFYELSETFPHLWTRRGPKQDIILRGTWNAFKWRMILKWFDPERTIAVQDHDPGIEELGSYSRIKRFLVMRWLPELDVLPEDAMQAIRQQEELGAMAESNDNDFGAVGELVQVSTPVAVAEAEPIAVHRFRGRSPMARLRRLSPVELELREASADEASGIMVDEKSDDDTDNEA